jgi:hypothetical protein
MEPSWVITACSLQRATASVEAFDDDSDVEAAYVATGNVAVV